MKGSAMRVPDDYPAVSPDEFDAVPQEPSTSRTVFTVLEWVVVVALLVITARNVGPVVSLMLGAVAVITAIVIMRIRHHRNVDVEPELRTQLAARHRYFPEHPGSSDSTPDTQ
jgi:hypothetical protein